MNRELINIEEEHYKYMRDKIQIDKQTESKGKISKWYSTKEERQSIHSKLLNLKKN